MRQLKEQAPAKVNLDLRITGRRPDGYHELDSVVAFTAWADRLTFTPDRRLTLEPSGPFAAALADHTDNLVLRAARRLAEHAGCPPHVRIKLDKRIPVAAGLGGGSADAAATLRGLSRLWQLRLADADLLGPVVPAAGPDSAVPTDRPALLGWLRARGNDLEAPARRLAPVIREVLAALSAQPGCGLAGMSGSGATCFGVFDDPEAAARAATAMRGARPSWWVISTATRAR